MKSSRKRTLGTLPKNRKRSQISIQRWHEVVALKSVTPKVRCTGCTILKTEIPKGWQCDLEKCPRNFANVIIKPSGAIVVATKENGTRFR